MQDGMPLRKSASFRVLTHQPGVVALLCQRYKCHGFGGCPVYLTLRQRLEFWLNVHLLKPLVHVKFFGQRNRLRSNMPELVQIVTSVSRFRAILAEGHISPFVRQAAATAVLWVARVFQRWRETQACLVFFLKVLINLIFKIVNVLLRDDALFDQSLCIPLRWGVQRADFGVHEGLGEAGLVDFVVSVVTVANHVDECVLFESLPVCNQETARLNDGFWICSIDSNNWHPERFDDVRRILKTTVVFRICCKTHLVVRDDVQ